MPQKQNIETIFRISAKENFMLIFIFLVRRQKVFNFDPANYT
jgi:hypothetical protein